MRLLNCYFLVCRRIFRIRIRGSRSALVLVHTALLPNCPCVRVSSRTCCFPGFTIFPSQFSPSAEHVCVEFPRFFAEIVWHSPRFPNIGLTFELCLCIGIDFNVLPNKLPKLARRLMPHGILRPSHVLARAFSLFHVGKCVTCAPRYNQSCRWCLQFRGVCLLVDFSRMSKNRLNPKRAVFPCSSRVWQFLNVFVLFWRDILEKMKLILTFCSICERENFLKTRFHALFRAWSFEG